MRHQYTITKQYARGPESPLPEKFTDLHQAKTFIQKKLAEDASLNVKVLYRLFEDDFLHSEYDQSKLEVSSTQSSEDSQGKGNAVSFRPTPLSTTPRPPGTPANNWVVDKSDEKKDKK